MEKEELNLLKDIAKKVDENNEMLSDILSSMRWARFFRILYWSVIILATMGAYYYVQPFVEKIGLTWTGLKENIEVIQKIGGSI